MGSLQLKCFGVGDGWPCPDRSHASFLYRAGKTSLLIDCGEPVDGRFKASGVDYNSLDGILLSHLHADHVGGFFMLMQGMWLESKRRKLPVHLPAHGIKPLQAMLRAALLPAEMLARLHWSPLKSARTVRIGGARVTPYPTTHLDGLRPKLPRSERQRVESYCFLVESGRIRVGHSSDLGTPEDLEPLLVKPLDLLVCELAHFTPEQIFAYLRGRKIKRVIFVHLAREYWENLAPTRRLAAKTLPDMPHHFARDDEEFEV
jgi:ribonuclease BN (tRNA processing enzyme)